MKINIQKKYLFQWLILAVIPLVCLGCYSYYEMISKQELQLQKGYEDSAAYIQYNIDSNISDVKDVMLFIARNPVLQEILTNPNISRTHIPSMLSNSVEPCIWFYLTSNRSFISNIQIYSKNFNYNIGRFLHSASVIEDKKWYKEFQSENQNMKLVSINGKLHYIYRIKNIRTGHDAGIILAQINQARLFDSTVHINNTIDASVFLNKNIIYKKVHTFPQEKIEVSNISNKTGLTLKLYIPVSHVKYNSSVIIFATIGIAFILGLAYIGLQKNIRKLDAQVNNERKKQEEMRLTALRAQINPHFLYNILSMINWKAKYSNNQEISRITTLISSFYRTSLNKGREDIAVKDELKNVDDYLKLKQLLLDNSFEFKITCDEKLLDMKIINFILQPIVENAVVHGVASRTSGGIINIKAETNGDDIIFSVYDNGKGMQNPGQILSQDSKGYGIKNVNERIKLTCGDEYGIIIYSGLNGTTVYLKIKCLS